jgi:hypothetical protein
MEPRSSAGRKKDVAGRVGDAIDQIERVANLKTACRRGDRMSSRREFIMLHAQQPAMPATIGSGINPRVSGDRCGDAVG